MSFSDQKKNIKRTNEHNPISNIAEIIDEARNGRMFILADDEDRENEGDLSLIHI